MRKSRRSHGGTGCAATLKECALRPAPASWRLSGKGRQGLGTGWTITDKAALAGAATVK